MTTTYRYLFADLLTNNINKVGGPMRFHVVALPHTQVTKEFAGCAFTEKEAGVLVL